MKYKHKKWACRLFNFFLMALVYFLCEDTRVFAAINVALLFNTVMELGIFYKNAQLLEENIPPL